MFITSLSNSWWKSYFSAIAFISIPTSFLLPNTCVILPFTCSSVIKSSTTNFTISPSTPILKSVTSKYKLYLPTEEEFKKELNLDNYVKKDEEY